MRKLHKLVNAIVVFFNLILSTSLNSLRHSKLIKNVEIKIRYSLRDRIHTI